MNFSKFYPTEAIVTFKQDGKDLSFAASACDTRRHCRTPGRLCSVQKIQ